MSNLDKYSKVFIKLSQLINQNLKKLKYQSIPEWDSVGHMTMVGSLEDTFKITLDMDDIIDFSSFEKR